jgi:hypothetical protein
MKYDEPFGGDVDNFFGEQPLLDSRPFFAAMFVFINSL